MYDAIINGYQNVVNFAVLHTWWTLLIILVFNLIVQAGLWIKDHI